MKAINILSIGNSFSQDAQRYLHALSRSEGIDIQTVNLMIGGCSLERHFRNMIADKRDYILEMNGNSSEFMVTLKESLTNRAWDYITLQQASHHSADYETYQPYLNELACYVRKMCPKAKILIHQTWGYETGSERVKLQGFESYEQMFAKVKESYEKAAADIQADGILRSGEAFLSAIRNGIENVHRDTFHAKLGIGRFILALVWYKSITGNDIKNIKFNDFDENVSEKEYISAIKSVGQIHL